MRFGQMQVVQEAITPALPGFYRLIMSFNPSEGGEPYVDKSPIIAWRITSSSVKGDPDNWAANFPTPICLEPEWGQETGLCPMAILCPDGTVIAQADQDYASQTAWVAVEKERLTDSEKRWAETAAAQDVETV